MGGLHTPQRAQGESREAYTARRRSSHGAMHVLTHGPSQAPFVLARVGEMPNWVLWWTGQRQASPIRRMIRQATKVLGSRQARKVMKAERRMMREQFGAQPGAQK